MALRFRLLGIVIVACGIAFCHGAWLVWPSGPVEATVSSLAISGSQVVFAAIAAVLGVLNLAAGIVILVWPPVRDAAS